MKPSIINVLDAIHAEDTHAKMRYLQSINMTRPHPDSVENDGEAPDLELMEKRKAARVRRFQKVRNLCKSFGSKSFVFNVLRSVTFSLGIGVLERIVTSSIMSFGFPKRLTYTE